LAAKSDQAVACRGRSKIDQADFEKACAHGRKQTTAVCYPAAVKSVFGLFVGTFAFYRLCFNNSIIEIMNQDELPGPPGPKKNKKITLIAAYRNAAITEEMEWQFMCSPKTKLFEKNGKSP